MCQSINRTYLSDVVSILSICIPLALHTFSSLYIHVCFSIILFSL